jgi:hypothetical protein
MTKLGRKVARDLEWIFYHEVVYNVKAVMRYVSKIDDIRWVQETMDRAKLFDRGDVWLNGERSELPSDKENRDTTAPDEDIGRSSGNKRDSGAISSEKESDEQAKKRARLEMIEAAKKRALDRRQNRP